MQHDPSDNWFAVGVVYEGDPIDIDGINPWEHSWISAHERVEVRHPAYPTQIHDANVYVIERDGRSITFAAGELSNNVWGFYRASR